MLVMLQSDVLYAVMMSVYMPINNLKPIQIIYVHATCMHNACHCCVNCKERKFTLWMQMSIDINVDPHASCMSLDLRAACIAHAERHSDVARHACCRSENTVLCILSSIQVGYLI